MCEAGVFHKSIIINNLWQPGPRKSLIFSNLQQNAYKRHFFLVYLGKARYYIYMKVRKTKTQKLRLEVLFTKSRPHKVKTKTLHRKLKHKEQL